MKRRLSVMLLFAFAAVASAQVSKSGTGVMPTSASSDAAPGPINPNLTPSQIFLRARPSVVVIIASDQNDQREALGSGFIVGHGKIVTNHHVVEGMNQAYVVFSDGATKAVTQVAADSAQQDLIVLSVDTGNRSPVKFGDEMSLQQGDSVYALGAPEGLQLTFTNGIVSSFRKSNTQFLIQTTAPIAHGSSGGPLFDRTGRVVGVTTSMLSDAPGIYFSVGIGDVRRLLKAPQGIALSFDEWAKQHPRFVTGLSDGSDSSAEPSLRDTISWMESFSQDHGLRFFNGKPSINEVLHSDSVRDKPSSPGCAVWEAVDYYQVVNGDDTAMVVLIDLSDLSPESVRVDGDGVVFEIADASAKVHFVETSDPTLTAVKLFSSLDRASNGKEGFSFAVGRIDLDSPESNQRFANALKHAVSLCGGVKAPF